MREKMYTIGITYWNGTKYTEKIVKIKDSTPRLAISAATLSAYTISEDIRKIQIYEEKVTEEKVFKKRILVEVLYERTRFKFLQRFAKPVTFIVYDPMTDEYENFDVKGFYFLLQHGKIDDSGDYKETIVRKR